MAAVPAALAPILEVQDLRVRFDTRDGVVHAVNGVSLGIYPSETLGLVGESGCGKSVISLSIMGLIPQPPGRIETGTITLGGRNLLRLPPGDMRQVRGKDVAMIFQEPMTSLNPVLTVGFQIAEALRLHQGLAPKKAWDKAVEFLQLVRIPDAADRARSYPHQLSGGMRQRAMIAMALSCGPKVLIADEPTTALDVTIQAQILALMRQLKSRLGTAILIITHDLGVIAEMAQRVVVLYAGCKMEEAPVAELFAHPRHPYTRGLLASIPRLPESGLVAGPDRLSEIPGMVPSMKVLTPGCPFTPRCGCSLPVCRRQTPPWQPVGPDHGVACWAASQ